MEIDLSKKHLVWIYGGTLVLLIWLGYSLYMYIDLKYNYASTTGVVTGFDQDANGNLTVDYQYSIEGRIYKANNYRDNHYIPKIGDTVIVQYSNKDYSFSKAVFENSERIRRFAG